MKEKHFVIKVLEYASSKPNGFTYENLTQSNEFTIPELQTLGRYFEISISNLQALSQLAYPQNPLTIFEVLDGIGSRDEYKDGKFKYILTNDALFNFLDYQGLVFATKNAEEAKKQANKALYFSIIALVASTLVTLWISTWVNDVRITDILF